MIKSWKTCYDVSYGMWNLAFNSFRNNLWFTVDKFKNEYLKL